MLNRLVRNEKYTERWTEHEQIGPELKLNLSRPDHELSADAAAVVVNQVSKLYFYGTVEDSGQLLWTKVKYFKNINGGRKQLGGGE